MPKRIAAFLLIAVFILTSGFGCAFLDPETQNAMKPITLKYWRVFDGEDAFNEIIKNYKAIHPYVSIEYRKLRYAEYEKELLEAMAEDKGPDIFSIGNSWVGKYESKIEPLPEKTTMVYPVEKGTLKKEIIPELRSAKTISLKEFKDQFVDVAVDDAVVGIKDGETGKLKETIMAMPLSVDALAVYYNRDLLNNAGIAVPPAYWNKDFQEAVKKLTKQDINGQVIQSGIALGGGKNIERSGDILSALMLQNGAVMMSDGRVTFDRIPAAFAGEKYNPGIEALRFYTDFSNPAKEVYTWNKDMTGSLDMFLSGRLAMMVGYAYHLPTIKSQAPKLKLGIAKLPQIEGSGQTVNFANYWVEVVSKKSGHKDEAWDFIQFAAKAENAKTYLAKTGKPPALRSLIDEMKEDEETGVFADEVLTAKSWYHGKDALAVDEIMAALIDDAATGTDKIENLISQAATKVQQTVD
ncbi:MAG: extracellular solute-binding protein [Patescibacteria group bacterium]|jgi:ABC-type glycerol-3-phosphate transport system substrate-binding protein